MAFSQELYREFVERKRAKQQEEGAVGRRAVLRACLELPDGDPVTLESSILLLRRLRAVQSLSSVEDIVTLMERRRAGGTSSDRQLQECRLIYFLWAVIEQETIDAREFKQLLLTLAENTSNRQDAIRAAYGEKEGVQELIEAWDSLAASASSSNKREQPGQLESISDFSIIKSKNDYASDSNKENISYFQEEPRKPHHQTDSNSLEKSFQRTHSRGKLHSRSNTKLPARTSHTSSSSVSSGLRAANFLPNEILSAEEEKSLVSRLYRCDQYRQREELRRQSEQQRVAAELEQCSFKPRIDHSRANSRGRMGGEVRGYEKAVGRMKSGYKKTQELRQNLEYRIWPTKPISSASASQQPPKFLSRVKESSPELFQIVFTIGRHSIRVRIRESDRIGDIVANIAQIYALKEDSKAYIRAIIEEELNNYHHRQQQPQEQQCDNQ